MGKSIVNQMLRPARLAVVISGAVGVALLAAACSSGASSTPASSTPAGSTPAGSTPASTGSTSTGGTSAGTGASGAAAGSSPSGSATVIGTASSSGGTFLTDGGRAVYLWVKDTGDMSTCAGACAGAWPPVTAAGGVTAAGSAKPSDLSTITRADGTKQVTYDGHPLYFFAGDSGQGTATGQGSDSFGAKWWLVAPTGSDVTATVSSFTAAAAGSGSVPAAPAPASQAPPAPATSAPASSAGGGWS